MAIKITFSSKRKLAVLIFGTFNPITKAHLNMAYLARQKFPKADIVFVPVSEEYLKDYKECENKDIFSNNQRIEMISHAIDSKYNIMYSRCEMDWEVPGDTYNTVQYMKRKYKKVIVCLGADNLNSLPLWDNAKKLIKQNTFLIIERDGVVYNKSVLEMLDKYKKHFIFVKNKYGNISSTCIRNAFHNNRLDEVKDWLDKTTYNYLKGVYYK